MAESMARTAFWYIMPRNIVKEDRRFIGADGHNGHDPMALMMKVVLNV
jgi:hypothetical protein